MIRDIIACSAIVALPSFSGCAVERPLAEAAPFVHVVLFKVRAGSGDSAAEITRDIREILAPLPTVKGLWVGPPAPTATRPIVDASYDVGLLLLFEDQRGLQEYLDHPRHVAFAEKHDTRCDVRVFDFVPRG